MLLLNKTPRFESSQRYQRTGLISPFTAEGELDETKKTSQILNSPTKPKSVTTQMKALDEYIPLLLFTLFITEQVLLLRTQCQICSKQ